MRPRIARFFHSRFVRYVVLPSALILSAFFAVPMDFPDIPNSTILLDKNGREIAEIVYDQKIRHRSVDSSIVPIFFRDALIAIEDRHYYEHLGISPTGIGRSLARAIEDWWVTEGASTIPAQYIRSALWPTEPRTIWRKIAEFVLAVKLSVNTSKSEILSKYLNSLAFGRLAYGPESAARVWFNKPLAALSQSEQLALVTLAKNPTRYDPIRSYERFRARYVALANRLAELGMISKAEKNSLTESELRFAATAPADTLPYVRDFIATKLDQNIPLPSIITLPIDLGMTERATTIAEHVRTTLANRGVSDYAILIVDRETMELRTMIGGANYSSSDAGQVNAALALRQPWSTLKPFTYLLADKYLGKKPEDSILDLPVAYQTAEGYSYEPKNYSLEFAGAVSQAEALAESLNVPAVKLANEVGIEKLYGFLKSAWVESLDKPASYYGLSLTLGSAEIPLYQLLRAYSVFAHAGEYCDIRVLPDQPLECRPLIEPEYVSDIVDVLSNSSYKIRQFPLYSDLDFSDRFAMVKTGTSRNYRDTWSIGFTRRYMIGVWTGNKSWAETDKIWSVTGAGAIFGRLVRELEPAEQQTQTSSIGKSQETYFEITHPLDGANFSPDTNSSTSAQSIAVRYRTNIPHDRAEYFYDTKPLRSAELPVEMGTHTVLVRLIRDNETISERSVRYRVRPENE